MHDIAIPNKEAVGVKFSLSAMQYARDKTIEAVQRISTAMQPGMTEQEAKNIAKDILEKMGMKRTWHQIIVRFGKSTLKTFDQKIDQDNMLGKQDIFFIDLGVVWNDHEGDAGDTFVIGHDLEMQACADAARALWKIVSNQWLQKGLSGIELYHYADERAKDMGWKLNLDIKGHRVCDFPHAIYRAGDLGDFAQHPNTGLWILEIQISHPTRPFGAFYEDLLIKPLNT